MVKRALKEARLQPFGLARDVIVRLARQLVRLTVLSAQTSTLDTSAD